MTNVLGCVGRVGGPSLGVFMSVKTINDLDLRQKRVLVRVDYNTPIDDDGKVADDTRIKASLPTLQRLFDQGCKVTLMSHLGRPKNGPEPRFSLKPVAERLAQLVGREVMLLETPEDYDGDAPLQLLENLRFFDGEKKNDAEFAARLAKLGECYVNDAFGAAHRAHASIDAVCAHFEHKGAGLLLEKELHYLQTKLAEPERPFLVILGGAKVSDKLAIIENLLPRVDGLAIGGAMSYTFLKARGVEVGASRVEEDFLDKAREIIDHCAAKGIDLLLPLDHVAADRFDREAEASITIDDAVTEGRMALDIGPETINLFASKIHEAKTVVWNGPMGVFEWDAFSTGTLSVAEAVAEVDGRGGIAIIGGGDSVSAIHKAGVSDRVTHISTGGGASLELLGGAELPGVVALAR